MAEERNSRMGDQQRRVVVEIPRLVIVPAEAKSHLRAAVRESLLAVRGLLDAAIERTEERPRERLKARHIKVE